MTAARDINLTLNEEKCKYRMTKVSLLGHVIEKGSKQPDPERLKALNDFPTPKTLAELNRLIGFFAYYAKWIRNYSDKIQSLLEAQKKKQFPLDSGTVRSIELLKQDVRASVLTIPDSKSGSLIIETDASGSAIAAVLSQCERPIAFFSRTLSETERKMSTVEREALAIIESSRKWRDYILTYPTVIKTDQRAVSFIFSKQKTRIKNDKLSRWRTELSELRYDIVYRRGIENTLADTLTRTTASLTDLEDLKTLHDSLAHPGVTRIWEYIRRHNLAFTLDEVRNITANCETCLQCKPRYFCPSNEHLIKATHAFERLNIDILGPKTPAKSSGHRFLLVVVDEFSRFTFAFAIRDITTSTILSCLQQLFSLFGTPSFIHSDRGSQFMAEEFNKQLMIWGISHSRTTPYNPTCNGQTERYNGVLWKSIQCILHARKLHQNMWESVLSEALAAMRTLICTATGETPHSRLFSYARRGTRGYSLPSWLSANKQAYLKIMVRNKSDPLVKPVRIIDVINPHYARVEFENGRVDTVSTRHLAPGVQGKDLESDGASELQRPAAPLMTIPPSVQNEAMLNSENASLVDRTEERVRGDSGESEAMEETTTTMKASENKKNKEGRSTRNKDDLPARPQRQRKPPDRLEIRW